jgi:hypothetical protein
VPVAAAVGAGVPGPPRVGHGGRGPQQPAEDQQQFIDHRPRVHAGKELSQAELGRPAERGADEDQRGSGHTAIRGRWPGITNARVTAMTAPKPIIGERASPRPRPWAMTSASIPPARLTAAITGPAVAALAAARAVSSFAAEGEAGTAQRPIPPERGIEQRPARRGVTDPLWPPPTWRSHASPVRARSRDNCLGCRHVWCLPFTGPIGRSAWGGVEPCAEKVVEGG